VKQNVPDWENSSSWNEFEWEQALKYSDDLASRYFRMLERFGDLPDAEELISARLGDQQLFEVEEPFFDEWFEDDAPDFEEAEEFLLDDRVTPGDSWYFESSPVYRRARLTALGWCNILASVLEEKDRFWGMKVLLSLGRLLSYLALSVSDGRYDRVAGSIAFAKRALQEVNIAYGIIDEFVGANEQYEQMFKLIKKLLLENHDQLVEHLQQCRERLDSEGDGKSSDDDDDLDEPIL